MHAILVTGGAGFIGSNFIPHLLGSRPDISVVNLDALTYAGNLDNLADVADTDRYTFIEGDICDDALVEQIFTRHDIRGVIHFAAESHVDNSISGPAAFIRTNVTGTFTLVDAARNHWMREPHHPKNGFGDCRFLHISTDEVYGSLGDTGLFTEITAYAPNSPYSASKAASDMIVRSYFHTYGLDTVITNCSNNFGPKQHEEKLIPVIIKKAVSGQPIPIYGDGGNIRDWLYVADHCRAVLDVFQHGRAGETYNIGARNERANIDIARTVCTILDEIAPKPDGTRYADQITFVADRPGHDRRYAIDPTKIETEIGWKPVESFESGLRKTVQWYLAHE